MSPTTNPSRGPVDLPDTTKPIRPAPRNLSKPPPAPRLAPDEEIGDDRPSDAPPHSSTNGVAPAKKRIPITISTTVQHRGRTFTISASDIRLDAFCDLLDEAGYAPLEQPQQWQTLPDGTPICPKHHTPMRQRSKQGDEWWSHNVGTKEQPVYCKGYHGKDSPGYER